MKTYDKDATCTKCGYGGIEDVHRDEVIHDLSLPYATLYRSFNQGKHLEDIPEHIARTCKNCGYSWREEPVDAEENCSFGKFTDVFIKHLSEATGESRDEILKRFKSGDTENPAHAIEDEPGSTSEAIRESIARTLSRNDPGGIQTPSDPDSLRSKPCEEITGMKKADPLDIADVVAAATGITRAELLKPFPSSTPVIEVGDVVGKCEDRECNVLSRVGSYFALHNPKPLKNPVCACTAFHSKITLIRKGPKVHTFKRVQWSTAAVHGAPELERHSMFVGCDNFETFREIAESDKTWTITATEEVT